MRHIGRQGAATRCSFVRPATIGMAYGSYRTRLILYSLLAGSCLAGMFLFLYFYTRVLIEHNLRPQMDGAVNLLNTAIEMEEDRLLNVAKLVRSSPTVLDFFTANASATQANNNLDQSFDRQFDWLPVTRRIIVTYDGGIVLGAEHQDLAQALLAHRAISRSPIFYAELNSGLEMVAWLPIPTNSGRLAVVALTRVIDQQWIESLRDLVGGELFVERNGIIALSSLNSAIGQSFVSDDTKRASIANIPYFVQSVSTIEHYAKAPRFWYGVSLQQSNASLQRHRWLILLIISAGTLSVLGLGIVLARQFLKPLKELINLTHRLKTEGITLTESSSNEIETLKAQCLDLLRLLQEKHGEIERLGQALERSNITDPLTHLYNRRYLQEIFPKIYAQAKRDRLVLSAIHLDVDHFRQINDRFGHVMGDHCLTHIAQVLGEVSRTNDLVFHIGGEAYFILCVSSEADGVLLLAEKIRSTVEQRALVVHDKLIPLTISAGTSHADFRLKPDEAMAQLLYNAEKALQAAKFRGRNQVASHPLDERRAGQAG